MRYLPPNISGTQRSSPSYFTRKQHEFCQNPVIYVAVMILLSAVAMSFSFSATLYVQATSDSHDACQADESTMDLTRDDDGNGLPDALEESLACIECVGGTKSEVHIEAMADSYSIRRLVDNRLHDSIS